VSRGARDGIPPRRFFGSDITTMLILGISELDNDSGAVLVRDGQVVGAANEERFTRVKQQAGVPFQTINWLLRSAGATIADLDRVIVVRQDVHSEYSSTLRALDDVHWFSYPGDVLTKTLNYGVWKFRNYGRTRTLHERCNQELIDWTLESHLDPARVERANHHFMHAACAYYGSGFEQALAFTVDGQGDGQTATLYWCDRGTFRQVHEVRLPHSAGAFYAAITKAAGYRPARHEGKITGLAAHGHPDDECLAFASRQLYNVNGTFEAPYVYGSYPQLTRLMKRKGPELLAYAYQHVLEDVLVTYVRQYARRTGARNLCAAGGVCANVRLNQKLFEIPEIERVFVFPHMSDGGLGWGAAMWAWHRDKPYEPRAIHDVYWGPCFSDDAIAQVLDARGVRYSRPADLERRMADLLADGELIARFQGAMEFGPRALCHRSILYQPTDPTVNKWLNEQLHRTEFMPFAPVTLEEEAPTLYRNFSGAEHAANFMTITFDCTADMARSCPAVVHIDGTARPQTVRRDLDASTYRVLSIYRERTGLASIINTSFNMHEEPIVCTPDDAVRSCRDARFRYLAIGPFLAEFDFPSPRHQHGDAHGGDQPHAPAA
jgi:carbamoyltransferase